MILYIVAALVLFELLPFLAIVAFWVLTLIFLRLVNFYHLIFGRRASCRG